MAVTATGALFQPLIGWVLDLNWQGGVVNGARHYAPETFQSAFTLLIIFLAIGLFCGFFARETLQSDCRRNRTGLRP